MAISKIILNGVTQIDLTSDTVQASNLISPNTAHGADGEAIVGIATSGVDVPVFTITWDSNWSTITSITCNKTFSECYSRGQQEEKYDAILIVTDGTTAYENGENYNLKYNSETYSDYILLTIADIDGCPYAELIYNSDGTFEYNNSTRVGQTLNVSTNGTYTPSQGQMYNNVVVNVPSSSPSLQVKTNISPTTSSQTITADSGYDGLSSVQINAMPIMTLPTSASSSSSGTSKATIGRSISAQYINIPTGYNGTASYYTISATPNGSVTAPSSISGTTATVTTGTNTLTLTKTISVTPNVTTAGYISSGTAGDVSVSLTASINTRSSSDLTVSGATVTAPAGYYSTAASKSVSSMTLPTSATASATSGYTSKATISRSTSDQYINIPVGYNASGAYYKINAVANGTEGTPTATKGTVSNHQVSITPSVTNTAGYISGGTKTGTAIIVTASELASGNKSIVDNGTNIDVVGYSTVSVAVPFSTITTSSSNPSGGNNGDIWIKTS